MNLKYYLRGLGLGIVITAVLLGITAGVKKETLTDEEIATRAKALGMVEESELSERVEKAKGDTEAELRAEIEKELRGRLQEEIRAELEAELVSRVQPAEGETEAGEPGDVTGLETESEPETGQDPEPEAERELIEFTVYSGELPQETSSRLEQAGLIESASEFEKYLLGKGYDRSIVAYTFHIPADADEEQIARIITGRRSSAE